jgi:hypothetical protein
VLVVRVDAGSGLEHFSWAASNSASSYASFSSAYSFVSVIDLPTVEWYRCLRFVDWKRVFSQCKMHREVHDGRCLFSGYNRMLALLIFIFGYQLLVALRSIEAPFAARPYAWLLPVAVNAGAQIFAQLFDYQLHATPPLKTPLTSLASSDGGGGGGGGERAALEASAARMAAAKRMRPTAFRLLRRGILGTNVAALVLVVVGLNWKEHDGSNPAFGSFDDGVGAGDAARRRGWDLEWPRADEKEQCTVLAFAAFCCAASAAATFLFPVSSSLEASLPVARVTKEQNWAAVWFFWVAVFIGKAWLEYYYISLPLAGVLVEAPRRRDAGPVVPFSGVAGKIAVCWVALLAYLSSLYLGFVVISSVVGLARGFHDLGVAKRCRHTRLGTFHFNGPWATSTEAKFKPIKREEAAEGIARAERGEGGGGGGGEGGSTTRSSSSKSPPPPQRSKFAEGWSAVIDDMERDYLLSRAESKALRQVPGNGNRLPRSMMPRNREAKRRLRHLLVLSDLILPETTNVLDSPSFTVLIPHYGESIYQTTASILDASSKDAPLIDFLVEFFPDEWARFVAGLDENDGFDDFGGDEDDDEDDGGDGSAGENNGLVLPQHLRWRLRRWASRRTQTLYRTISGMAKYREALIVLSKAEKKLLSDAEVEAAVDKKFTLLVSMQRLPLFDDDERKCLDMLFEEFPFLKVAYIDEQLDDITGEPAFYSCVIDKTSPLVKEATTGSARTPLQKIRLPGHPILGHGKADNQNHAIVFTRGELLQCIDANQDNYMETALSLGSVLSEFNEPLLVKAAIGRRPAILGFSEHIFSDLGTPGEFAATHESVFGTIVQRTLYRPLDARLHYGHPDFIDKLTLLGQGGVSKAVKGLHLSEDVYAGLDLKLRGGRVKHREYFKVGKGRDMGFNSVMSFYSKISQGNGQQVTTRQIFRLGRHVSLPVGVSIYV